MALKGWFGGSGKGAGGRSYTIDDLIALERFDEAESKLRARVKANPRDLRFGLKLADLLMKLRRRQEAVEEYLRVAEGYAREGFFDKAIALLRKISKLAPGYEEVELKVQALLRAKQLEQRRDQVIGGLLDAPGAAERRAASAAFELKKLWKDICFSSVVENLSDEQLRRLFRALVPARFESGQQVAAQGDTLEELYLVGQGEVEARVRLKTGSDTVLRSFTGGDLIGDRALLEHKPWPADYVTSQPTVLLRLTREGLEEALRGDSDPRSLLDTLRGQRNDHQVATSVAQLEKG